jgi:hypothetical protein
VNLLGFHVHRKSIDFYVRGRRLQPGTSKPPESALTAGAMAFVGTSGLVPLQDYSQWWRFVSDADWRHPNGPGSSI